MALCALAAYDPFHGKDQIKNGGKLEPGDPSRRAFTYFMVGRWLPLPLPWGATPPPHVGPRPSSRACEPHSMGAADVP